MENHLQSLLADIAAATSNVQKPWNEEAVIYGPEWKTEEEDRRTAPRKTVEAWTGIQKSRLPSEEDLTDEQVSQLLEALKELLAAYNNHVICQFAVPDRVLYRVLRSRFDREIPFLQWHDYFYDLCAPGQKHFTCALGDYCECGRMANYLSTFRQEEDTLDAQAFPA